MLHKKNLLRSYLNNCPEILETLRACQACKIPQYYLAGGAITQLIWNNLNGHSNLLKVKDFDIVYHSTAKNSASFQSQLAERVTHQIPLDVVNQADVHEWYPKKYGNSIAPLNNTEAGIQIWLSAFAIGIRQIEDLEIYAPFGLEDAFNMLVRPNKLAMNKANYLSMTKSFKQR